VATLKNFVVRSTKIATLVALHSNALSMIQALAGKMRVLKRVIARAGFLPGFFMLIWRMNSAAFAAARVRATETPEACVVPARHFRLEGNLDR
jgi:hypothetical protein